ncbi:mucin-1-like [Fukomys damarensis]|uniref:mucin-1-like n=1 Tax=Fukomys damarensis TaxID=885580 RepID=UPI0014552211|nr:mucin-1-like [Fukomys damarensis]
MLLQTRRTAEALVPRQPLPTLHSRLHFSLQPAGASRVPGHRARRATTHTIGGSPSTLAPAPPAPPSRLGSVTPSPNPDPTPPSVPLPTSNSSPAPAVAGRRSPAVGGSWGWEAPWWTGQILPGKTSNPQRSKGDAPRSEGDFHKGPQAGTGGSCLELASSPALPYPCALPASSASASGVCPVWPGKTAAPSKLNQHQQEGSSVRGRCLGFSHRGVSNLYPVPMPPRRMHLGD